MPQELTFCLSSLKKSYSLLDDSRRMIDDKVLFKYEENIISAAGCMCATKLEIHQVFPPRREKFLTESSREHLKSMYCIIYGNQAINHIPLKYEEFSNLEVFGKLYTSLKSRSRRSAAVMGIWCGQNGKIINRSSNFEDVRTGLIEYFLLHVPKINGISDQPHILAKVKWYEDHPRKFWMNHSIVLSATLFHDESEASFIPVSRIMSRCATIKQSMKFDYGEDNVVCIPLHRRLDE